MVDKGGLLEILSCYSIKNDSGRVTSKKLALKVSPSIRNYLIKRNNGYVYLNLSRFKVFDRLNVPQCYHCYEYNHFAKNCPTRANAPTCGRCALSHETRSCQSNFEKCVNCAKKAGKPHNHCSFSYKCPDYEKERNYLMSRIDYDDTKN